MLRYLLRRLFLIPFTLLAILLVNFVILNFAPGDPTTIPAAGDTQQAGQGNEYDRDDQYLLFREHYGLTLPVLLNRWPSISRNSLLRDLETLKSETLSPKRHNALRVQVGDRARYTMPLLLELAQDSGLDEGLRDLARRFFVRGGTRSGYIGANLTSWQRIYNNRVAADNTFLRAASLDQLPGWFEESHHFYRYEPTGWERFKIFFLETRLARYLTRVFTLDFGTLRADANRRVVGEVFSRIGATLTLSIVPLLITFVLCQILGFSMALRHGRWQDVTLNILLLILYALPIFVVAPFLIEKVALRHSLPISGLHGEHFAQMVSWRRFLDLMLHLALPLIAVTYGAMAVQARLARTAVLEVLRQDYVRTARAKGLPRFTILWKHVGRNAAITMVTALAASFGAVLGGTLIVETIFGIDGFGKFFYESIVQRDFNVVLFSSLLSAALALVGYLAADLAYTVLDPRVTLD
jgi:peptide/nickel transport system permease protein